MVSERKNSEILNNKHVLLIDDEAFLVRLWKSILEKQGYKVSGFTDSKLASENFKNNPHDFDIVITDQSMPLITGEELAAEFLKIRSDIKVIVCTGYPEYLNKADLLSEGVCQYLLKPFGNDVLIKAIEENLRK
ncbi:response regulator [Clostridium hydrogenum]|uniref:response regulator n=1 Tax=Clostridium hydrogenum TaxID=2855764 RepID=UPI001F280BFE|nr:response regulator [Clostridium hydrogenum]